MKCSITSINVKILNRALHSLAKIGDELHIDPQKEGLSFRAVNAIKSAYAEFVFFPPFFTSYKYSADGTDNGEVSQCKIAMRSCLSAFRAGSDKNIESCALRLAPTGEHLVVEQRCRSGSRETHHLPVIETDGLVAVFDRDDTPNQLVAEARVWVDAVHNFQTSQDEVTLSVGRDRVSLSSYVDQTPDPQKVVRTELCLRASEFELFDITEETAITFKLKDLRSILAFADGVSLPIAMHFDSRGKPVVFVVKSHTFDTTFVLATLSPPADTQTTCSQGSALVVANPIATKRPGSSLASESNRSKRQSIDTDAVANDPGSELQSEEIDVALKDIELASTSGYNSVNRSTRNLAGTSKAKQPSCIVDNDSSHRSKSPSNGITSAVGGSRQSTKSSEAGNSRHPQSTRQQSGEIGSLAIMRNRRTTRVEPSPFSFVERASSTKSPVPAEPDDFLSDLNFEPYEHPAEAIPPTPPPPMSKQARAIFQRCFEPTFDARQISRHNEVLVDEDSEEEES